MSGAIGLGLHGLSWADIAQLSAHFMLLSVLSVGGAITTAPDMQRYLVHEQGWLTDAQFTSSVAIAQAAPGPNILFVALMGWNAAGPAGALATMVGIMLPSSLAAIAVGRYRRERADAIGMRAFTTGMVPITLGLLLSTGWVLTAPTRGHWITPVLVLATVIASARFKVGPLWLIGGGALAGMVFLS